MAESPFLWTLEVPTGCTVVAGWLLSYCRVGGCRTRWMFIWASIFVSFNFYHCRTVCQCESGSPTNMNPINAHHALMRLLRKATESIACLLRFFSHVLLMAFSSSSTSFIIFLLFIPIYTCIYNHITIISHVWPENKICILQLSHGGRIWGQVCLVQKGMEMATLWDCQK